MTPDYGDITDPTSGRDLTIEYKSAEEAVLLIQLLLLELNQKKHQLSEDSDKKNKLYRKSN